MSETSVTTGRILTYSKDHHLENLEVISKLPSESEKYSMFTQEMFCKNTLIGKDSYVIGFARSYKNVEHSWTDWMNEFEDIIRQMKWDSVNVFLETEMFGTHQFMWQNKFYPNGQKIENEYNLIEKEEWYFGKGHRNFWGTPSDYGWEKEGDELQTLYYLVKSIDKTLEGKPARMKMFKKKGDKYELLGGTNGVKQFVSHLLKLYILEKQKYMGLINKYEFDEIESLLHKDSPMKISQVSITAASSFNNTDWVYHFADKINSENE